MRGVDDMKAKVEHWLDWFGMQEKRDTMCKDLSKGQRQKVMLASAFIHRPKLLFLDEPFANLDPSSQIGLKRLIRDIAKNTEITFLISSHDLTHVTEVCNRIVLLEKGKILKDTKTSSSTLKELEEYFSN